MQQFQLIYCDLMLCSTQLVSVLFSIYYVSTLVENSGNDLHFYGYIYVTNHILLLRQNFMVRPSTGVEYSAQYIYYELLVLHAYKCIRSPLQMTQ